MIRKDDHQLAQMRVGNRSKGSVAQQPKKKKKPNKDFFLLGFILMLANRGFRGDFARAFTRERGGEIQTST